MEYTYPQTEVTEVTEDNFPIEVFPKVLQDVIKEVESCLNFPADFTSSAILVAASSAIGNTRQLQVVPGWIEKCNLWLVIVGEPGVKKSHVVSWALDPITEVDSMMWDDYQEQMENYNRQLDLAKKQKVEVSIAKPKPNQLIATDSTIEALMQLLESNPKGILLYSDEIRGLLANLERRQGADKQHYMTLYTGKNVKFNRATSNSMYVKNPFLSMIGTAQPDVLDKLGANENDGFFDRILFVYPDTQARPLSKNELDHRIADRYRSIINELLEIRKLDGFMYYEEAAKDLYHRWDEEIVDRINTSSSSRVKGLLAKMQSYVHKFSVVIELLHNVESNSVTYQSLSKSIQLCEYFIQNAIKVQPRLGIRQKRSKVPPAKAQLAILLGKDFTTNQALGMAQDLNVSERTILEYLSDSSMFKKLARGRYENLTQK